MLEIARQHNLYIKLLEEWEEVNRLKFDEFNFFKNLGIIDYKKSFKIWLRKYPRPTIIVCLWKKIVVGWIFIEISEISPDINGNDIFVIRSIEITEKLRHRNIGTLLVYSGIYACYGHIITKPLNTIAKQFFSSLGFVNIDEQIQNRMKINKPTNHMIFNIMQREEIVKDFEKTISKIHINGDL